MSDNNALNLEPQQIKYIETVARVREDITLEPGETRWIECSIDERLDRLHSSQQFMVVSSITQSIENPHNEIDRIATEDKEYEWIEGQQPRPTERWESICLPILTKGLQNIACIQWHENQVEQTIRHECCYPTNNTNPEDGDPEKLGVALNQVTDRSPQ